jgi:hypothetical protein
MCSSASLQYPGAFDSALTSVLDVLGVAEELRETVDPKIPAIENVICGIGRTAVTRRGLTVPIEQPAAGARRRRL